MALRSYFSYQIEHFFLSLNDCSSSDSDKQTNKWPTKENEMERNAPSGIRSATTSKNKKIKNTTRSIYHTYKKIKIWMVRATAARQQKTKECELCVESIRFGERKVLRLYLSHSELEQINFARCHRKRNRYYRRCQRVMGHLIFADVTSDFNICWSFLLFYFTSTAFPMAPRVSSNPSSFLRIIIGMS